MGKIKNAYARLGLFSIIVGGVLFFLMQIMVGDAYIPVSNPQLTEGEDERYSDDEEEPQLTEKMSPGILQLPALGIIALGVLCLYTSYRLSGRDPENPSLKKKKKPDLMDYINETRHR